MKWSVIHPASWCAVTAAAVFIGAAIGAAFSNDEEDGYGYEDEAPWRSVARPQNAPAPAPDRPAAVPALENNHPLSPAQAGELLISELRCNACHARTVKLPFSQKTAPDLANVGARVAPAYLLRFIADPAGTQSGTSMPDMLAGAPAGQRPAIAEAITHFLVAQSAEAFTTEAVAAEDVAAGAALYHRIGCIACHPPRGENGFETLVEAVVPLGHLGAKYSQPSLTAFLFQPLHVRSSGRMPDMKLTRDEARQIAAYLIDASPAPAAGSPAPLEPKTELVARGRQYLEQYNCAACHELPGVAAARAAMPLDEKVDAEHGCLARQEGHAPRYDLSDAQRQAIVAALAEPPALDTDTARIDLTLVAFNCIACHVRGDYGGVPADRNLLFGTDEPDLGDDARIPPPLTLVGAKLQSLWLKKVLFDGASVREYMPTRMPQFGEPNLRHLPDLFERADQMETVAFRTPGRNLRGEWRKAGQELLGDKGLNCVTCHGLNGIDSPNFNGMDLMTSAERLKPSWFYHFLLSPGKVRPGIVMPDYWPDGQATHAGILDGDTDDQIEAIWYYLSLGRSAPTPSGLHRVASRLEVTNTPRTYRGRSNVAGFRGIAVGFPGGVNYAFNAETGALAALWRGEYVNVNWGGQAAGDFRPTGRYIQLAQEVPFCRLPEENAPWPVKGRPTGDDRVDPDPLYPRRLGYRFRGYHFDDGFVPTFRYQSGEVAIEDRSIADTTKENPRLRRTFTFNAPAPTTLWFRALTGEIEKAAEGAYRNGDVGLTIPDTHAVLRPLGDDDKKNELLLRLSLPKGQSKLEIEYELLR